MLNTSNNYLINDSHIPRKVHSKLHSFLQAEDFKNSLNHLRDKEDEQKKNGYKHKPTSTSQQEPQRQVVWKLLINFYIPK